MAAAIYYHSKHIDQRIYFTHNKALLPVLNRDGTVSWLRWGRQQKHFGQLPLGGWARLERIQAGHWDQYFPTPVKIPAHAFMEKDFDGNALWYPLVKGQCLQGLVAHYENETRLYVVTIAPVREDAIHERWPRIVNISR